MYFYIHRNCIIKGLFFVQFRDLSIPQIYRAPPPPPSFTILTIFFYFVIIKAKERETTNPKFIFSFPSHQPSLNVTATLCKCLQLTAASRENPGDKNKTHYTKYCTSISCEIIKTQVIANYT